VSVPDDAGPAPYFFLSYAHTAPLAGMPTEPTDHLVKSVFEDLSEAVRRAARLDRGRPVGFFDGLLTVGEDWNARVTRELGDANVFVPLYSPRYFSMTWPGREWQCFSSRLPEDSAEELRAHIVPVLWAPMADTIGPPNRPDPLALANDVPEYEENGLRALSMLNLYGEQYRQVIARLARRIVDAARARPLPRTAVTPIDRMPSAFQYKGVEDDFVVAVAAPTRETAAPERDARWYGESSTDWHPFEEQGGVRLADYTLAVAERLSFSTKVLSVRQAAEEAFTTPEVVLIDPWIAAPLGRGEGDELAGLRALYSRTRAQHWALPVVVLNERDPESTACQDALVDRITRILDEVKAPSAATLRSGSEVVTSFNDFAGAMPGLVAEAERRYLRYSPDFPNDLSGGGRSAPGDGSPLLDSDGWELRDGSGA